MFSEHGNMTVPAAQSLVIDIKHVFWITTKRWLAGFGQLCPILLHPT
jgi:hypothetical protein